MFKLKCECGKVIEGYTEAQAEYMLEAHKLSRAHRLAVKLAKGR